MLWVSVGQTAGKLKAVKIAGLKNSAAWPPIHHMHAAWVLVLDDGIIPKV